MVGFEPVETYRALPYANQGTLIVTDVRPIVPMTVTSGNEKYPEVGLLLDGMRKAGLKVLPVEATRLAEEAGARVTVNSVLIGAISALSSFPLDADLLHSTLMASVPAKAKEVNERAYLLGREAVLRARD
jgi:indolepyruvate ferredoxin oxidoreductase beta subunit